MSSMCVHIDDDKHKPIKKKKEFTTYSILNDEGHGGIYDVLF